MPNFKRIGGGEWKPSVDLTWNDPCEVIMSLKALIRQNLIDLDMRFVGFFQFWMVLLAKSGKN